MKAGRIGARAHVGIAVPKPVHAGIKLRGLFANKAQLKAYDKNTLNIWAALLFFSLTLTFMVDEFATLLDTYTLPNLALLVTHFAFLASQYFAVVTILDAIGAPASQRTIRRIRSILCFLCAALLTIYISFLSKMPVPVGIYSATNRAPFS